MAHRSEPPQTSVASCAYASIVIDAEAATSQEIAFMVVSAEASPAMVGSSERLQQLQYRPAQALYVLRQPIELLLLRCGRLDDLHELG